MAPSGHRLLQVLSVFRDHPRMSCLLLLLCTPPFYPVFVFFTPLLVSTALCLFAFVSLSPYFRATDAEVERQSTLGTGAEVSDRSRRLDCSRQGITADADVAWFDSWIKGVNEAGRTWLERRVQVEEPSPLQQANKPLETVLASMESSFSEIATSASIQSGADSSSVGLEIAETYTILSLPTGTALKVSQVGTGKIVQDESESFGQGETLSNGQSCFHDPGHTQRTVATLKEEDGDTGKSTHKISAEELSRSGVGSWGKDNCFPAEAVEEKAEVQRATESGKAIESEQSDASKVSSLRGQSTGKELERFPRGDPTGQQEWGGTQVEGEEGPRFDGEDEGPRFDEDEATVESMARQGLDALEREIEEAVAKLEELPSYEKVSSFRKLSGKSPSFRERRR